MNTPNAPELPRPVLYEDKFVSLTKEELTVFTYYFPFGSNLVIPIGNIASFAEHNRTHLGSSKGWGMGIDFQTWWASDLWRGTPLHDGKSSNVLVKRRNVGWPSVGFSVDDRDIFLQQLEQLMQTMSDNL